MSYYDNREENDKRGIDYDLVACLDYNPQGFTDQDIDRVLAVWEGQNDGDDWRWILRLKDDRYAFLQGGCNYTGWDCQSWASTVFALTAEEAAQNAIDASHIMISPENSPANAGLGHMLNILSGKYNANKNEVYDSLVKQLAEGKSQTWREGKDAELGV